VFMSNVTCLSGMMYVEKMLFPLWAITGMIKNLCWRENNQTLLKDNTSLTLLKDNTSLTLLKDNTSLLNNMQVLKELSGETFYAKTWGNEVHAEPAIINAYQFLLKNGDAIEKELFKTKGVQLETPLGSYNPKLIKYCIALEECDIQKNIILSDKQKGLLVFVRAMLEQEKIWQSWRYTMSGSRRRSNIVQADYNVNDEHGNTKSKEVEYYQDIYSPHYKRITPSIKIQEKNTGSLDIQVINAFENEAYHNELRFLITQLHLMELDWNSRVKQERLKDEKEYNETYDNLKKEIEWFQKPVNRKNFTYSCMHNKDAQLLQEARMLYNKKHRINE